MAFGSESGLAVSWEFNDESDRSLLHALDLIARLHLPLPLQRSIDPPDSNPQFIERRLSLPTMESISESHLLKLPTT